MAAAPARPSAASFPGVAAMAGRAGGSFTDIAAVDLSCGLASCGSVSRRLASCGLAAVFADREDPCACRIAQTGPSPAIALDDLRRVAVVRFFSPALPRGLA